MIYKVSSIAWIMIIHPARSCGRAEGVARNRRHGPLVRIAGRVAGGHPQPKSDGALLGTCRPAMVREGGLEPPSLAALDFESSASTDSATLARPADRSIAGGRSRSTR